MRPTQAAGWLLALMALLTACGSSPPVRYYTLEAPATRSESPGGATVIGIGPLPLPEYLDRPQLVTRGPGQEMQVDEYSRWLEPLNQELLRGLTLRVARGLPTASVIQFPYSGIVKADYRLIGRVDRFDADAQGQAVLAVQWGIGDGQGTALVPARRALYSAQAERPGDPASAVAALNRTLDDFGADVVAALNAAGIR